MSDCQNFEMVVAFLQDEHTLSYKYLKGRRSGRYIVDFVNIYMREIKQE
jgi:hypothetical protein